ncbi:MAG: DUF2357 domain-containing protein [Balneolaceae bacterium]|nr:DUF2357 domain-containing protein [Balneolaceae bacterium]
MSTSEKIPIELKNGEKVELHIVADDPKSLLKIEEAEALKYLEALVQLEEGNTYEYVIKSNNGLNYVLYADAGVVKNSNITPSSGQISPNNYVGTLVLQIKKEGEVDELDKVEVEVRSSRKADYRTEYRFMLEEITEKCTDLLMQYTSPANQPFDIDHDNDPKTLYQRFAFLKSVLDSEGFWAAVHRITTNPVTAWMQTEEHRDIRSVRRMNRNVVRQLAGSANRVSLPNNHPLRQQMESVPEKVITRGKIDSVDTPENRFIKYALETFKNLCSDFKTASAENSRLHKEAKYLEAELEETLNHSIFHKISRPSTLPLNSPVLQRKEGYREVLRVWLMVNLAARLTWKGGEDVYKGGKRDVATLYEYWLFFKLLDLLENLFRVKALTPEKLIEETNDKLGLKLKQGRHLPISGVFETDNRKFHVKFSFNRTFSGDNNYPSGGSWTRSMRPDYTLTIWPFGINEEKAEKEELIVHLHFDAKYKVENLSSLFGSEEKEFDEEKREEYLNQEKGEQSAGRYTRADLLKMHSYRDSIRRTAGAYILYPGGDGVKEWRGYHEIVPGLGAFTMKPNPDDDGSSDLRLFLKDVIQHFKNRTSQREKLSFRRNEIHEREVPYTFEKEVPEFLNHKKLIPDEVFVVVGYYNDEEHLSWVLNNGLYNVRYGTGRGGVKLTSETVSASYLLLRGPDTMITDQIFQLKSGGPKVYSSSELIDAGYPRKEKPYSYLVYEIEKPVQTEFKNRKWDVRKMKGYNPSRGKSTKPLFLSLMDMMKAEV